MRLMYGSALPTQCYSTLLSHGTLLSFIPISLLTLLPAHRHPCNEKPSAIADITLRLSEGIQDLKLEQQLAPTREAISRTITTGSANFFKAVEGVKGRFMQRSMSSASVGSTSTSSGTIISKSEVPEGSALTASPPPPAALAPTGVETTATQAKERLSGWGVSVGSFFASRAARFSAQKTSSPNVSAPSSTTGSPEAPSKEVPWVHSSDAFMSASPTGDAKLPPMAIQTPLPGPVPAADVGEKTPRRDGFHPGGDAESQGPTHEHEQAQARYDGDSDEEPSFGVAL
jgi:hypothetical protein